MHYMVRVASSSTKNGSTYPKLLMLNHTYRVQLCVSELNYFHPYAHVLLEYRSTSLVRPIVTPLEHSLKATLHQVCSSHNDGITICGMI